MQGYGLDRRSALAAVLPRTAGQLAAAFRACRQRGAIPAAAKRLDQRDCVHHAAAENIYRSDFGSESRILSGCDLEVAGDAAVVTRNSEIQISPGRGDSFFLRLGFVLEDPQCRNAVLDLLKTGQHGLAIISDFLIVDSVCLV